MAEPGDDELSRRYRALAREEPAAQIDAAILAASRRAVGARPGGARRWAGPVSIAAVLVLGIGVTLRMQQERPGIETSAPMSEYQMPEARPEPRQLDADTAKLAAPTPVPAPLAKQATPKPVRVAPQSRLADAAPAAPPAPAPTAPPPAAATMAVPPAQSIAPRATTVPAPPAAAALSRRDPAPEQTSRDAIAERGARDASGEAAVAPRAKREAGRANEARALGAAQSESPADMLERIAKLRGEARHAEADKALEEFRGRYPEYRIPENTWERVRPR